MCLWSLLTTCGQVHPRSWPTSPSVKLEVGTFVSRESLEMMTVGLSIPSNQAINKQWRIKSPFPPRRDVILALMPSVFVDLQSHAGISSGNCNCQEILADHSSLILSIVTIHHAPSEVRKAKRRKSSYGHVNCRIERYDEARPS